MRKLVMVRRMGQRKLGIAVEWPVDWAVEYGR